jgi:LmbE family N-acetylglucosaminyl deacetylase
MNVLIVVAHPDDEVLGAGATVKKFTSEGNNVDICIMCTEAKARAFRPEDNELHSDMDASAKILGIRNKYKGSFPNIEMNNSTHLSLVQFIERAIIESDADVIITHHPADTNNDHMHTSIACQAAIRLFQRRKDVKPLTEFWFMEVLSSTEWSVNTSMNRFQPNTFVEVGEENVDAKIKALATYRDVMRPYPHPRSEEAIKGLAAYRGAQSGTNYAEAFETVLRRI